MKFAAVLLLFLALVTPGSRAQDSRLYEGINMTPVADNFRETLSRATLALYEGKQICKWSLAETGGFFIAEEWKWGCEFKSTFHCTATVVDAEGNGHYKALTAGHCFHHPDEKYFVSDEISDSPVLREIKLLKYEDTDRYDYAIFSFTSLREYPVIHLNKQDAGIPPVGTPIVNVNFGMGAGRATLDGKVVSKAVKAETLKNRYLVSIGAGPGASGSAVVDANTHEIVGLAEAIYPGTQMSSIVIPTGSQLADFIDDDSAGLRDQPQVGAPPQEHHSLSTYSRWDGFSDAVGDYAVFVVKVLGVAVLVLLIGLTVRFLLWLVDMFLLVRKLNTQNRLAD